MQAPAQSPVAATQTPLTSTLHCTDSDSDGDSDSSEVDNSDSDCSYGGLFLASAEGFELEQRHSWPVVTEMGSVLVVAPQTPLPPPPKVY